MPRTVIFHEDGSVILNTPEVVPVAKWNTGAYVYVDQEFPGVVGWYMCPLGAGRGGTTSFIALSPDEVPAEIRLKLLLLL